MKRQSIFFLALFSIILNTFGQRNPTDCFYRHYTGSLDTNMRLTMDIFSQNGKISGYYFYAFEIREGTGEYHFGKTIPLAGTLDGNRLILYEFNNTDSKFTGNIDNDLNITGSWQRRKYEDPISFSLSEDYKTGSIPLRCYLKKSEHRLNLPDVPKNQRPSAKIDILLLYPEKSNNRLKTSIDLALTNFLLNDSIPIQDPELLMENITFDFFESYRRTTDGIPNIEQTASFDWLKKLFMEVIYNENSLLTLRLDKYGFTGGAHGVQITQYRVFNLLNNTPVELSGLFMKGFEDELREILDKKLRELNGIKENENLIESGFFVENIDFVDNFYINNDGIGFFYNVYEIASYATGTTELFCTFYDLRNILRPDHPFFWIAD